MIWWGEQPLANDPVDEAAQAAWLAAYEWMLQETQESASWWVVCHNDDDAHVYQPVSSTHLDVYKRQPLDS